MAGAGERISETGAPALFKTLQTNIANIKNFVENLEKLGRATETTQTVFRRLTQLNELCNIANPEEVKLIVAKGTWGQNTKRHFIGTYNQFLKFLRVQWEKPTYHKQRKIPFIPTEAEIDTLIAASSKTIATLLQLLKETGARIGEAVQIEWTDVDFTRHQVAINHPEKGSLPRTLPISDRLIDMLNRLPRKRKTLFSTNKNSLRTRYDAIRKRTATKLNQPRLLRITFHTNRFWKATMDYHKIKDIKHVQQELGHTQSSSTDVYIQIEASLFLQDTDEWTAKIAKTPEEAIKLVESGFIFVNNMGEFAIFKKRK